ncbi:AlpA family phage regulatory protein [Phaeobacter inhibens]|uniref:helix-turn-helix transcriptional regulator n=1 Tax=Phaeobacter inhibens TaxID=221822 RepID=UPI0021A3928A|nr:AlpA family phage regulatory protein [Phaeobacter inhibens]UWR76652.1 AlpA family phage regulatory protein [Phaeobacter inhibens]
MYLRVKEVAARYDVDTATIWRWAGKGLFPKPVKLGERVTRWRLSDVEAHEAALGGAQ